MNDYMNFFEKWLHYQFPRVEDDWNNFEILREVARIVAYPDDCAYWSNRDCWSMYDLAKQNLKGA
jgi:hypothetical protein